MRKIRDNKSFSNVGAPRHPAKTHFIIGATAGMIAGLFVAGLSAAAIAEPTPAPAPAPAAATCPGNGLVWWNELLSPDTDRVADFYSKVVGWKLKIVDVDNQTAPASDPEDRYTLFMAGDQSAAGLMKPDHPGAIHSGIGWFTYIQVSDVAAAVAAARSAGGTIVREPIETPEGARMAVVRDPIGNVFGLVTPNPNGSC